MKNIERRAAAYAELYASRSRGGQVAAEDFQAGFVQAIQVLNAREEFMMRQLEEIIDLAGAYQELYALSIARFTKEKLK